jgi:hypothetical protein
MGQQETMVTGKNRIMIYGTSHPCARSEPIPCVEVFRSGRGYEETMRVLITR